VAVVTSFEHNVSPNPEKEENHYSKMMKPCLIGGTIIHVDMLQVLVVMLLVMLLLLVLLLVLPLILL